MQAFYDSKPSVLEAVGNGSYLYRADIEEVTASGSDNDNEQQTQYKCEEVTVWSPLTSNRITEAVITDKWDNNQQQKLINEYNAAVMGLYTDEEEAAKRIQAYTDYLTERAAVKAQVDADCAELGIN